MLRESTFNCDNSENVAYDDELFPAYIRDGQLSMYRDYSAHPHWHEDIEFVVSMSGSMSYNINGEITEIAQGDGIVVNSRNMHYGYSAEHSECRFFCILLHPSLLAANESFESRFVNPFIRNRACQYITLDHTVAWQSEIISVLGEIYAAREDVMAQAIIQSCFFRVFELMFRNTLSGAADISAAGKSDKLNCLKKMLLYIQEHYSEPITIHDIAAAAPCCKSRCSAIFGEFLKEPPVTYLIKYRLSRSRTLLTTTDLTVTDIALECGFNGSSYFCEMFKRYYSLSPLAYRKQYGD